MQALATSLSCVTITNAEEGLTKPHSNSMTSDELRESRFPVGSSHNRSFGGAATARAIATRCRSPPERSAG